MKKDNKFLFVYIVFLDIILAISVFTCIPICERIVIGITCSSFIFSIADSDYAKAKNLLIAVDRELEFCDPVLNEINTFIQHLEQLENASLADSSHSTEDERKTLENKILFWEKYKADLINRIDKAQKTRTKAEHKKAKSNIVSCLGFAILFCIMIFETPTQLVINSQDKFTVGAFAIMLALQRRESKAEKAHKEQEDTLTQHRVVWEYLREIYQKQDVEEPADAD